MDMAGYGMFHIFSYINGGCFMVNAGKYTIPGSCGYAARVFCCPAIGLVMGVASGWRSSNGQLCLDSHELIKW